jgi:hypothetical protein
MITYLGTRLGADGRDYHKYMGDSFADIERLFEDQVLGTSIRSKVIGTVMYTSAALDVLPLSDYQ